jgi:hypothetical protein
VIDLRAGNELAIGAGDAEMARERLEPVARQLARRLVVAAHGVHRVDQLAAGRDQANAASVVASTRRAAARVAAAKARMRDASEVEPNAETARALLEEGEVEPVQVVILDDVGGLRRESARPNGE